MSAEYSKPVRMSTSRMEAAITDPAELVMDPADVSAIAHATATALLSRGQTSEDVQVREALVRFADEHGLDTLADLWARAHPLSLPGALWRLYVVRAVVHHNPHDQLDRQLSRGMGQNMQSWSLGSDGAWTRNSHAEDGTKLGDVQNETMMEIMGRKRGAPSA